MKAGMSVTYKEVRVGTKWNSRSARAGTALVFVLTGGLFVAGTPRANAAAECDPPPPGIIGWWAGDGNANDQTGNYNGTLEGGATATAAGLVGQAFTLDGTNGYVQIPDAPALHPTNFTVEAWVRFSSLDTPSVGGSPAGAQYIVFKQNSQEDNFEGIDLAKTRTSAGDVFRFVTTSASAQSVGVNSTTTISTGVWYHVAAVRGSNFMELYVNGQLQAQTTISFAQNYGTLPLYFGTSGESYWDHKFAGNLDEVTLYSRALASNEIYAIYAAGSAGKCKAASGPAISSGPQSQTVATGSSVQFTVTAGGTQPLSYQWEFNGGAVAGATNTSLSLNNVQSAQAGNYTVVVSNSVAAVTSAPAVLTVMTPATITTQPASQTVAAGANVTFTVAASGTAPLSYQWSFDGSAISGATATALTLTSVKSASAGNYTVVVTNAASSVTSSVAVLTVTGPPTITTQPASQSVTAGANVSFNVTASGTAPLSYQWSFNGGTISGATATSLALSDVQSGNAGNYTVVVGNPSGSVTSAVATLTVSPATAAVTISGATVYQTIDGFGVNANHRSWDPNALPPVLNALINQGGFTLFHVIFDNNNWEQTNDNGNANVMNWSYYNTIYDSAEFQKLWGIMGYLNSLGITTNLVPDFEGPVALWMGGLTLKAGMENEYAETIASCLYYARNTAKVQFHVVGPVNEPDITYSGINMSGSSQYVTVMEDLAQQLETNGMGDVQFSGPDLAETSTSWLSAIMASPTLMAKYAHFGLHSYQNETPDASGVYSFIKQSQYPNTHFWMTEYNVWCESCQEGDGGNNTWSYAQSMAAFLMQLLGEGASGAVVWEAYDSEYVEFNDSTGGNDPPAWSYWGLFAVNNINASPLTYTPRQGFYTLAQVALYVRPGAQRINVNNPSTPLTLLAFYNTNNAQFTITGVNSNSSATTLSCALSSLPTIPSLDLYYTSSTTNLCHGAHLTVNNNAFAVSIPADCVFTLTYSNAAAGQKAVAQAPYFLTPVMQSGGVVLSLNAPSGYNYQIEASADLVNWVTITNIPSTNGTIQFTDPAGASLPQRFYRAVVGN